MLEGETILGWIDERRAEMADLLERLVRAESPSDEPAAYLSALEALASELHGIGVLTRMVRSGDGRRHLYGRPRVRRPAKPRQLVVGHIDTVWPTGSVEEMVPRVDNGRFYGPGAYDMKGGLVQLVFALRALEAFDATPEVEPMIFVNSDEELGSDESAAMIRVLARRAERAFVLEPPSRDGRLKTGRKGVGRFKLVVHGRSAHAGSHPEEGISAILELSHQVQQLYALNDRVRGVSVNVGAVDGGRFPNVVADEATALIDVRAPTLEAAREVERAIRRLHPVNRFVALTVTGGFDRPPMPATDANRRLYRRAAELGSKLGLQLEEAPMVGGGSDANFTSPVTPTLDGLGSLGDGAHAAHEHVVVAELPKRAALLGMLLLEPA